MRHLKSAAWYSLLSVAAYMFQDYYAENSAAAKEFSVTGFFGVVAVVTTLIVFYYVIRFALKLILPEKLEYVDENNTLRAVTASTLEKNILSDIQNTAYHEAAHAVAVLACGLKLSSISTVPDVFSGRGGNCEWHMPNEGTVENYMHYMMISLAGDIAAPHETFRGSVSMKSGGDYQNALGAAMSVSMLDTNYTVSTALEAGMQRARTIVEQNQHAIEHLAENLFSINKHGVVKPKVLDEKEILKCLKGYEIVRV